MHPADTKYAFSDGTPTADAWELVSDAYDAVWQVAPAFRVATEGATLLASNPEIQELLAVQLRSRTAFDPTRAERADSFAGTLLSSASELHARGFAPLLRAGMVQCYSEMENFLKCVFVGHALFDRQSFIESRVTRNAKIPILIALEGSRLDLLFWLADDAWQASAPGRNFFDRSLRFLSESCNPQIYGNDQASSHDTTLANTLNELHDVRNSFVHHGGRATAPCARRLDVPLGSPIKLDGARVNGYIAAATKLCGSIKSTFGDRIN